MWRWLQFFARVPVEQCDPVLGLLRGGFESRVQLSSSIDPQIRHRESMMLRYFFDGGGNS